MKGKFLMAESPAENLPDHATENYCPSLLAFQRRLHNYGTPDLPPSSLESLSPVTNLALNLHGLSTNSTFTPKRRISWSSDTSTDFGDASKVHGLVSSSFEDCQTFERRLLRDVTLEKSYNQQNAQLGPKGSICGSENLSNTPTSSDCTQLEDIPNPKLPFSRHGLRRIRSLPIPSRALSQKPAEKENIPERHGIHDNSAVENSVLDNEISPNSVTGSRSFSRRLSVLSAPDWVTSDSDSQDSGCILSNDRISISTSSLLSISEESGYNAVFSEPSRTLARNSKYSESSKCELLDGALSCHLSSTSSIRSSTAADTEASDGEEFADGFDFTEPDQDEDKRDSSLNDLITGPIIQGFRSQHSRESSRKVLLSPREYLRPSVRRSLSMVASLECSPMFATAKEQQENISGAESGSLFLSRKRLLNREDAAMAFKRPDPPGETSFLLESKRRKSVIALVSGRRPSDSQITLSPLSEFNQGSNQRVLSHRSYSYNDIRIDTALRRSEQEKNLRGDYSGCNVLPVLEGRHPDLKTISCDTLYELVNGGFKDSVQCYTIIDCRYPYEYDGGHIIGAKNLFTRELLVQHFLSESETSKIRKDDARLSEDFLENSLDKRFKANRNVLIFHCEFSSERGPKLYRFLRKEDRQANKDHYPFLFYPEIYLLEGGYKEFFARHKELCEPQLYKPMSHKDHREDLNHFRAKSKSWNGDSKIRTSFRSGLKL